MPTPILASFTLATGALATAALATGLAAQAETPDAELLTRHLEIVRGPGGIEELRAVGREPGADPRAVARRFPVEGGIVLVGPDGGSAVLDEPRGGERAVRLLGPALEPRAAFSVPADRRAWLGTRGLVLAQASEHAHGTAFRLEFRDERGVAVGEHREPGRVLLDVLAGEGGGYLARSVDDAGFHVHAFDARGDLRWALAAGPGSAPVLASDAARGRTAVGTRAADADGSDAGELRVVDARGRVSGPVSTPLFHLARFAPDGAAIALAGTRSISLVRADGALAWTLATPAPLVPGDALAWSGDGRELRALVHEPGAEPGTPAWTVLSVDVTAREPRPVARALAEVPIDAGDAGRRVLELVEEQDAWRVVTSTGIWTLRD